MFDQLRRLAAFVSCCALLVTAAALCDRAMAQEDFNGYPCTVDCSGHQAGYDWADQNGITDAGDCGGNSQSFIEGCQSYTEEYGSPEEDEHMDGIGGNDAEDFEEEDVDEF